MGTQSSSVANQFDNGVFQQADNGVNEGEEGERHTSGAKARDYFHELNTGDKSPAYRPEEFFRGL